MKRSFAMGFFCAVAFACGRAVADEGSVCKDAYEEAQVLMKPQAEGKGTLLPAREALRTCLRSGCKDWMVADCSRWLSEVESRIPTVVFSARDTAGRDLTDVRVTTESGDPIVARLDGRTLESEAGERVYVFVLPDGTRRDVNVLVREGEKAQSIRAVFDAPKVEEPGGRLPPDTRPVEALPSSTLKYVGYGATGVGVVGLGLGTIFGLRAISEKEAANCDASNACDKGPLDDARSAATVSTVSFIAGGVLLAGGLALVLLSPSAPSRSTARAFLTPRGPGVAFGGAW